LGRGFVQPGNVKNPGAGLALFEVPLVSEIPDYLAPEFSTFLGLFGNAPSSILPIFEVGLVVIVPIDGGVCWVKEVACSYGGHMAIT
jgi:hypothetical protein